MDESGTNQRHAPLPPVTTRWGTPTAPAAAGDASIAPPFVPGTPRVYALPDLPEAPMPLLRSFDSAPPEEQPEAEAGAPAPYAPQPDPQPPTAPQVVPQAPRQPDEPLMPWEEFNAGPVAETHVESGPVVTSEATVPTGTARHDLDDWESAIDPDGGQAVPAWGDQGQLEDDAFSPPPQLDDEGAVMIQPDRADEAFPLDAFIIPPDAKRLPKGLEHAEELHLEIAEELARRLESVAQRLRREGFAGLLHHEAGQEPIDTLLAGVLAGYLSNRTDA